MEEEYIESENEFELDREDGEDNGDDSGSDRVAMFESDPDDYMASDAEENEDQETKINKEISTISFGSLLKAKKKLAKQHQDEDTGLDDNPGPRKGKHREFYSSSRKLIDKRSSKHAPTEVSSKKAVSRARTIIETSKPKARDPRFDTLSGSFKADQFDNSYGFLKEKRVQEIDEMRKTVQRMYKAKNISEEEKTRATEALRRMENRQVTQQKKEREKRVIQEWKKEERAKQAGGKRAFYLKKGEERKLKIKAQFDELEGDKQKLRKVMDKKRRKTAQKAKKLIPRTRE